ncbi:MAG: HIT family hydrolase, partial [Acidobacteria bacterium]|nr:HIT family hydrolase [Acidobacteriota bacterium]
MEINFTPWRLNYIKSNKKEEGCIFCKAFEGEPSPDNLVVLKTPCALLLLNRFPYNNGHLLVAPK